LSQVELDPGIAPGAKDFGSVISELLKLKTLNFVIYLQLTRQKHQVVGTKGDLFKFFDLFICQHDVAM